MESAWTRRRPQASGLLAEPCMRAGKPSSRLSTVTGDDRKASARGREKGR